MDLISIFGWIGAIVIIFTYCLNLYGILKSDQTLYALLNIIGSLFIAIDVATHHVWSAFILQITWAILAIVRLSNHKRKARNFTEL